MFDFKRRPEEITKRFWAKVVKPEYGCWIWQGARSVSNYGTFNFMGTNINAHRAAWIITHDFEVPPPGIDVLHTCNKGHIGCVTPAHLYLGTDKENTRDRILAGNTTRGERNWSAALTDAQAAEIKKRFRFVSRFDHNADELAGEYNVPRTTVLNIGRGRTWKHL